MLFRVSFFQHTLPARALCGAALVILCVLLLTPSLSGGSLFNREIPSPQILINQPLASADTTLYQQAYALQRNGQWAQADAIIAEIENPVLLPNLQAQRYLHRDYEAQAEELSQWLATNPHHLHASALYQLALKKGAQNLTRPTLAASTKRFKGGYGESFQHYRHAKGALAHGWQEGLRLWKLGRYEAAYRRFTQLASTPYKTRPSDEAAIAFWAYRCAKLLGKDEDASHWLEQAATHPRSFYGAQAAQLLEQSVDSLIGLDFAALIARKSQRKTQSNIGQQELDFSPEAKAAAARIEALIHIGEIKTAQKAFFAHYDAAAWEDRILFSQLANSLKMPDLQLKIGIDLDRHGYLAGHALYPVPQWTPQDGHQIDPALVYAVARQESGFNPRLRSHAGAKGMMQIMPDTARYMNHKLSRKGASIASPSTTQNFDLGQHYLRYLADKPYIDNNIVFLLAAYNAGPAAAKRWVDRGSLKQDPLYVIETIPFRETRQYVINVLTNYWMYREILHKDSAQATLLSKAVWPMAEDISLTLAAR